MSFESSEIGEVAFAKNDLFASGLPPGETTAAIEGIGFVFGWHKICMPLKNAISHRSLSWAKRWSEK